MDIKQFLIILNLCLVKYALLDNNERAMNQIHMTDNILV